MSSKVFYAYLLGGTLALILAVYEYVLSSPKVSAPVGLLYLIPALLLFYMAYKVYHEKNDSEMM